MPMLRQRPALLLSCQHRASSHFFRPCSPLLRTLSSRSGSSGSSIRSDSATNSNTERKTQGGDRTSESTSLILSHESKVQLGFILASGALIQLGIGAIVPCLPAYASSVGLTEAHVGVVVAVPSFARACLNLPAGRIADILGRKRPWVAGALLDGVGCLATAAAGSLHSMVGARLFMGGGSAIASSAAGAYGMDVVSQFPQHKGRILGAMNAAGSLAWVLGPVLGGLLAERGGITLPFVLVGGAIISLAPAVHLLLPETMPPKPGATLSSLRLRPVLSETYASFATLMHERNQRALMLMQYALFTGWSGERFGGGALGKRALTSLAPFTSTLHPLLAAIAIPLSATIALQHCPRAHTFARRCPSQPRSPWCLSTLLQPMALRPVNSAPSTLSPPYLGSSARR